VITGSFRSIYSINSSIEDGQAVSDDRYPEDTYVGRNSRYPCIAQRQTFSVTPSTSRIVLDRLLSQQAHPWAFPSTSTAALQSGSVRLPVSYTPPLFRWPMWTDPKLCRKLSLVFYTS
jgi:hypothetical protein